jgi:hypothetical protein
LAQVGKHGVIGAVIVPAYDLKNILINQWLENTVDFRFRAICMNGHHASCILRYSIGWGLRPCTDKDYSRAAKFLF